VRPSRPREAAREILIVLGRRQLARKPQRRHGIFDPRIEALQARLSPKLRHGDGARRRSLSLKAVNGKGPIKFMGTGGKKRWNEFETVHPERMARSRDSRNMEPDAHPQPRLGGNAPPGSRFSEDEILKRHGGGRLRKRRILAEEFSRPVRQMGKSSARLEKNVK